MANDNNKNSSFKTLLFLCLYLELQFNCLNRTLPLAHFMKVGMSDLTVRTCS